jgi:murein DD-endopeptidase MepM/ murein hydrolase activator NlpD
MIFSKFSVRQRLNVKRVASFLGLSFAVSLAGCSSQGISYDDVGEQPKRYSKALSIPIPSEPVYGHADSSVTASGPSDLPYWKESSNSTYAPARIERTALAPVQPASYSGPASGSYVGGTYAMQPVDVHEGQSAPYASKPAASAGTRYAQAGPGYDDRGPAAYKPSYRDYKPYAPPYRQDGSASRYSGPSPSYEGKSPVSSYDGRGSSYDYERSRSGYGGDYYIVVEGDTLFGIAKRYGLTTVELAELNGIVGSTIYAGQKLRVQGSPKYTSTNGYNRSSGDAPGGYGRDYSRDAESYADDERKAPSSGYSSYGASRYRPGYNGYDRGSTSKYDRRDEDRADERYQSPRRERYTSRYDEPAEVRGGRYKKRYEKPEGSYDSYSVQRGDTLYEIARRHGLSHHELAEYNDIPTGATLYPGQVLHVPKGSGHSEGYRPDPQDYDSEKSNERADPRDNGDDRYSRRRPYSQKSPDAKDHASEGEKRLAKADPSAAGQPATLNDAAPDPAPAAAAPVNKDGQPILAAHRDVDAGRERVSGGQTGAKDCEALLSNPLPRSARTFREPVQGLIVAKFGSGTDGSFNDGVDFSVPKGTPVKAAENGVVAYVGNELSGFGNLILVRHSDGYVTAYAHNDEVLVKRCDVVKRGQIISKAGATGKVTKPQLHFEVRKDSKPVDPEAYFSRS